MDVDKPELNALFETMFEQFGYDFRNYAYLSASRRVRHRMNLEDLTSVAELEQLILADKDVAEALVRDLSINVTEMFRDPEFFIALRQQVLPNVASNEFIKIWHAGCSSGEEIYSMAIVMMEEGLYDRCRLYGTDFNSRMVDKARQGIFPLARMKTNVRNYLAAGGVGPFSNYYNAKYAGAAMEQSLKENMLISRHDLAIDASFGEMQIIICRNVLIYFDRELQDRVFRLFSDSLKVGGFLCLGTHETTQLSQFSSCFEMVSSEQRIYRKIGELS